MEKKYQRTIAGLFVAAAAFLFCSVPAFAYPLPGTQAGNAGVPEASSLNLNWISGILNSLSAPFQNFINGIGSSFGKDASISNAVRKAGAGISIGSINQWNARSLFQNFDNWLFGIIGFHVSGFFNAIFDVTVWVLNLAKGMIDWILSFLR